MAKMAVLVLISLFGLCLASSPPHPRDNSIWPRSAVIKKDTFYLYWKHDKETITFRVYARTLSWFGFGLSPHGGMEGADIMVAWHLGGIHQTVIEDRYSLEKKKPLKDKHQDWHLVDGSEQDGWTKVTFRRKLDTCDPQDYPIRGGETQRIIWAIAPTMQEKPGEIDYHFRNRGSFSIHLLHSMPDNTPLPSDAFYFDIKMNNFLVPNYKDTLWWCYGISPPTNLPSDSYQVVMEPKIEEKNLDLVHHIVVYACYGDEFDDPKYQNESFECHEPKGRTKRQTDIVSKCIEAVFGWAVGGRNFTLPPNVGIPLFNNGRKIKLFRLEMHYDNQALTAGRRDSSGLRIWMTRQKREYSAWFFGVGLFNLLVPPNAPNFKLYSICDKSCIRSDIAKSPMGKVKAFAAFVHTHLAGRKIRIRHFREGVEIKPILVDDSYNFNYQDYRYLPEPVDILPGDNIALECFYDTTNRKKPTYFGLSTYDEMCTASLLIYPWRRIPICASSIQLGRHIADLVGTKVQADETRMAGGRYANQTWREVADKLDWTPAMVKRFEKLASSPGVAQTGLCTDGSLQGSFPDGSRFKTIYIPNVRNVSSFRKPCKRSQPHPMPPIAAGSEALHFNLFLAFVCVVILKLY